MKFDKKLPFAQVYGHATAKYEQFGRLYDAQGNLIQREILTLKGKNKNAAILGKPGRD